MKKENIQSRNRKLSAKARKKHSSFGCTTADMLKPLEKMYSSYAGMAAMGGMGSYYQLPNSASPMQSSPTSQFAAAGGMHSMMAASQAAFGGFGAAAAPSFGGMVSFGNEHHP